MSTVQPSTVVSTAALLVTIHPASKDTTSAPIMPTIGIQTGCLNWRLTIMMPMTSRSPMKIAIGALRTGATAAATRPPAKAAATQASRALRVVGAMETLVTGPPYVLPPRFAGIEFLDLDDDGFQKFRLAL